MGDLEILQARENIPNRSGTQRELIACEENIISS
jgi:hypothetical protein